MGECLEKWSSGGQGAWGILGRLPGDTGLEEGGTRDLRVEKRLARMTPLCTGGPSRVLGDRADENPCCPSQ